MGLEGANKLSTSVTMSTLIAVTPKSKDFLSDLLSVQLTIWNMSGQNAVRMGERDTYKRQDLALGK